MDSRGTFARGFFVHIANDEVKTVRRRFIYPPWAQASCLQRHFGISCRSSACTQPEYGKFHRVCAGAFERDILPSNLSVTTIYLPWIQLGSLPNAYLTSSEIPIPGESLSRDVGERCFKKEILTTNLREGNFIPFISHCSC